MFVGPSSSDRGRHRIVLRVLDHQIVGPDGELLGNVDDVQLQISDAEWIVTGLAVGPGALGRRLPGRIGSWTKAVWRRLQTDPDPGPAMVPLIEVTDIGSAIRVSHAAAAGLAASFGFETWLRSYVISRIPGAKGGGDDRPADRGGVDGASTPSPGGSVAANSNSTGDADDPSAATPSKAEPGSTVAWVSELIRATVLGPGGTELGTLTELVGIEPAGARDHLRITHLEYGRHKAGAELGYDDDYAQGPLLVGVVVRRWLRDRRSAPITDVTELDPASGTITLSSTERHLHPHRDNERVDH